MPLDDADQDAPSALGAWCWPYDNNALGGWV